MKTAQRVLGLALLAVVGPAPALRAQVTATGNIYVMVKDESGAVLPGVTATSPAPSAPARRRSGTNGDTAS
jgi:hypothetical protein